jgi:hypothetical protein
VGSDRPPAMAGGGVVTTRAMQAKLSHHVRVGAQVGSRGSLGSSVSHGRERSSKLTGGAYGRRRRIAARAQARARKEGGGVL